MAKQDNPFSLLGEDDDGGDITVLLAKVEARISAAAAATTEDEHPKSSTKPRANEFSSKPLPLPELARTERGRGRGDRGRGLGRAGFRYGSSGVADHDASGNLEDGYSRGLGSDYGGRGRGRGGPGVRGGRGRGRVRGFYEGRGLDNDNQNDAGIENQDKGGYLLDERDDAHARNSVPTDDDHAARYESRKFGDDRRSYGWEEKGYDSDNRRFRGGEGHERRGFGGGRHGNRGGGFGMKYVVKEPVPVGNNDGWNEPQNKEDASSGKELLENNALAGNVASGWEMPEVTNVPKGEEQDNAEQKQLVPEEVPEEKNPKEEDNEMTLNEYEKVLQEKRKALESLKAEERKVVADKDFESMLLIEKKKEGKFIKLKIEKEKLKKKDSFEKEEKARKSLSINEFLKPAEGERYSGPSSGRGRAGGRGRGRGDRGGFRVGYAGRGGHDVPALQFEDPAQFPLLGAAAKA